MHSWNLTSLSNRWRLKLERVLYNSFNWTCSKCWCRAFCGQIICKLDLTDYPMNKFIISWSLTETHIHNSLCVDNSESQPTPTQAMHNQNGEIYPQPRINVRQMWIMLRMHYLWHTDAAWNITNSYWFSIRTFGVHICILFISHYLFKYSLFTHTFSLMIICWQQTEFSWAMIYFSAKICSNYINQSEKKEAFVHI